MTTTSTSVDDICSWMESIAPLQLSESWDNTGLLLGDRHQSVSKVMTCLTLTKATVDEALQSNVQLIIAHHPLPFKPLGRITTDSLTGNLVWRLAQGAISVYAPHTAWDSTWSGINHQTLSLLTIENQFPIVPSQLADFQGLGAGRYGTLREPQSLGEIASTLSRTIPNCRLRCVDSQKEISVVGSVCGSGGSLVQAAAKVGCDLLITGEATFHQCLEAEALDMSLLMIGHFASEQFAMVELARRLTADFHLLEAFASERERDPVRTITLL